MELAKLAAHHFEKGESNPGFRTKLTIALQLVSRAMEVGIPFRAIRFQAGSELLDLTGLQVDQTTLIASEPPVENHLGRVCRMC